jgi:hypothetical protein
MITRGEKVSEVVVIDEWLRAELASETYEGAYRSWFPTLGIRTGATLDNINPIARRRLLGLVRGYGVGGMLFTGFPPTRNVDWFTATASLDALESVLYINESSFRPPQRWRTIAPSRRAGEGARRLLAGECNDAGCAAVAKRVRAGETFAKLIFASEPDWGRLVVIEGHTRLTAYLMERIASSAPIEVIVGESPRIAEWACW